MKPIAFAVSTDTIDGHAKFWNSIYRVAGLMLFALVLGASNVFAYTAVTSTDPLIEQKFIASTTNQFNATVITNPFFAGTYQVNLLGLNPNYNPPVSNLDLLNTIVSISTQSYPYGWADGIDYERWHTLNLFNNQIDQSEDYNVNCSTNSGPFWNTTVVIDSATCQAIVNQIYSDVYSEFFSTPPVVGTPNPIAVTDPLPPKLF